MSRARRALFRAWLITTLALHLASCGGDDDIVARLSAISGVRIASIEVDEGLEMIELYYTQPLDHDAPERGTFEQYVTLIHRSDSRPMVLQTEGYAMRVPFAYNDLRNMVQGNLLTIEHRFYGRSRPENPDWDDLTVRQAAADVHRLVEALKPIYTATWLSTGGSKDGATALFHRRFYPDDVNGTLAYVTPMMTAMNDTRFLGVFDEISSPGCRAALHAFQRTALMHRDALAARAVGSGTAFTIVDADLAVETAVVELEWSFWQRYGAYFCDAIPGAGADDDAIYAFVERIRPITGYGDERSALMMPYYFQVADELGYPALDHAHLDDLLRYEWEDLAPFMPDIPEPDYDPSTIQDLLDWIATDGERIFLVYGETDPWTAGAIPLGDARDSYSFVAEDVGHGAHLYHLTNEEMIFARRKIGEWAGVQAYLPITRVDALVERSASP